MTKSLTFDTTDFDTAVEYCKQEFEYNISKSSHGSLRDQLNAVWKQTGEKPPELDDLLEMPYSCWHIWKMFIDLHNARSSNGYGYNPISYQEIWSYAELMKTQLEDWEVALIKRMDNVALGVFSEDAEKKRRQSENKSKRK